MDFFSVVRQRTSVRNYSPRPISQNDLEMLIDAGRLAPTARGEEPWEFILVTDKNSLGRLAEMTDHGRFLKGAAAGIITLCKDTKYYLEDGSAATENILLAATALGIGSCWIAGDKKSYTAEIMKYLDVPSGYKLVSIIALGYPETQSSLHKKRSLQSVLHKGKFSIYSGDR